MYTYIYVYICVCVYIYTYICVCIYTHTHIHTHTHIYMLYTHIYICVYNRITLLYNRNQHDIFNQSTIYFNKISVKNCCSEHLQVKLREQTTAPSEKHVYMHKHIYPHTCLCIFSNSNFLLLLYVSKIKTNPELKIIQLYFAASFQSRISNLGHVNGSERQCKRKFS